MDKDAKTRTIGDNSPEVELVGPHGNSFTIFITDSDGDVIGVKPGEARLLQKKLTVALAKVVKLRYHRYEKLDRRLKKA